MQLRYKQENKHELEPTGKHENLYVNIEQHKQHQYHTKHGMNMVDCLQQSLMFSNQNTKLTDTNEKLIELTKTCFLYYWPDVHSVTCISSPIKQLGCKNVSSPCPP
ncbi:hypothetical protein ACF0H5_002536 [Mactra antiquata]